MLTVASGQPLRLAGRPLRRTRRLMRVLGSEVGQRCLSADCELRARVERAHETAIDRALSYRTRQGRRWCANASTGDRRATPESSSRAREPLPSTDAKSPLPNPRASTFNAQHRLPARTANQPSTEARPHSVRDSTPSTTAPARRLHCPNDGYPPGLCGRGRADCSRRRATATS